MELVEDEWDRDPNVEDTDDLLFVRYDSQKVTLEKLLQTVREQEFEAKVK